ncbi:MAG TPA: hypothetical protein VNJ05_05135 [Sphingomicrobium sp.]|nr:hypothetical protein [Sphingomicrobium sp.]
MNVSRPNVGRSIDAARPILFISAHTGDPSRDQDKLVIVWRGLAIEFAGAIIRIALLAFPTVGTNSNVWRHRQQRFRPGSSALSHLCDLGNKLLELSFVFWIDVEAALISSAFTHVARDRHDMTIKPFDLGNEFLDSQIIWFLLAAAAEQASK